MAYVRWLDHPCNLVPLAAPHLPPLGRKGRHLPAGDSETRITQPKATKSTAKQRKRARICWGEAQPSDSFTALKPPLAPPDIVPAGDTKDVGVATTDIAIDTREPAGITFKWTKTSTMEGLAVVDVVDGSIAARHGGVVPGMFLVGVNKISLAGFTREATMQAMQSIAGKPRELSLACIARNNAPAPSHNPATEICSTGVRGTEELGAKTHGKVEPRAPMRRVATPQLWQENSNQPLTRLPYSSSRPVSSSPVDAATASQPRADGYSCLLHRPASGASSRQIGSDSAELFIRDSDDDAWSMGNSLTGSSHSLNYFPSFAAWGPGSGRVLSSNTTVVRRRENIFKQQQDRILPLRFVGSRGNISLFDRDHILGVKKRDIEFILSSGPRSERQRANSTRSLGELTRDWRNDPCSTPARRRRLINDVCKVIVRSYEHASVVRVVQFRKQAALATKIQAIARMRATRTRNAAKIFMHRGRAALCLQLAWLSHIARNRLRVLRDERDRMRRADQLARAREDMLRRKEKSARAEREKNECARRQHRLELVTLLQRRFRSLQVTTAKENDVLLWGAKQNLNPCQLIRLFR